MTSQNVQQRRTKLLSRLKTATESRKISWQVLGKGILGDEPFGGPDADYGVTFGEVSVQLGKHTRNTSKGPRQTYFLRVLNKKRQEADFFDEFDDPSPAGLMSLAAVSTYMMPTTALGLLYDTVANSVRGIDETYDEIFQNL